MLAVSPSISYWAGVALILSSSILSSSVNVILIMNLKIFFEILKDYSQVV